MTAMEQGSVSKKPAIGKEWEPRIIAFLCNWCSYAGADLAGISRIQYPPNIRVVRVPCSSRVSPYFIIKSLQRGWDGVLVSGCHPGECHYISGNLVARRRFAVLKDMLEYIGVEPDRVNFSWISAAEGERFSKLVREVVEKVKASAPGIGFNALSEQLEDLAKAGIVDPAKVTRSALENAASIASMLLTTEALVAEKPEPEKAPMPQGPPEY